ncbi:MAG TPA: hypothetical protein EYH56_01065 [Nanoarchaeota archaeon]|nr:hypothetical protein [Nanoarchaeota archaeon]
MTEIEKTIAIEEVFANLWTTATQITANAVGALVVLAIGFITGKILGRVVREVLVKLKVDSYLSEEKYLNIKASHIGDLITRWTIYLVFIQQAALVLGVQAVSQFVHSAYQFILGIVAAVITILIGYGIAVYLKDKIITTKTIYSDITGNLVFGLVLYISVAIGLKFIQGINTVILDYILLVLIGSVGIGLAIAIGLGLKDIVAEMAKEWIKAERLKEKKSK